MGMTLTQKIFSRHCGQKEVKAGQLIEADVDLILGNDLTSPVAIREFEKIPDAEVLNPDKIVLVMDHFTPNKDIACAGQCMICREFARKHHIPHFYDVGKVGIEHVLLPEKGFVRPGMLIAGADSHTSTYGALGAFSTGIGSTDMAAAMLEGKLWFQVPEAIRVIVSGHMRRWVTGKDVMLWLLKQMGTDGASYMSMEFEGDGIKNLTMDDRLTICNMAVEAGAKNAIFPVDVQAETYLKSCGADMGNIEAADLDAVYKKDIEIHLEEIPLMVAAPSSPDCGTEIKNLGKVKLDQVVIGSCTNGRLSDLQTAAKILKGKKTAPGVRVIVIPATQKIYLEALRAGYIEALIEAGCAVSTPSCGPCIGGSLGILGEKETALATTNRNFKGRMGHTESKVYLSGPAVAAASAVAGYIVGPEEVMK